MGTCAFFLSVLMENRTTLLVFLVSVKVVWLPTHFFYLTEYTKPFNIRVNLLYEKQVLLREEPREDENRRVYKSRIETSRQGNPFRESAAGGS